MVLLGLVAAAAAAAADDGGALDHTVVVADRPLAQAGGMLTAEDLGLFQADSLADLGALVPGLGVATSDAGGFGDVLAMRGSANTLFFSPPAVAMVVDDVPLGDVFSYPTGLLDLAGMRVLRGPQGAAFGRNGAAGVIEMWTPAPSAGWSGGAEVEFGSDDLWGARLRSGGPLGGGVFHTLQVYHSERDGFLDNPTLGRSPDDRSVTGALASLYWRPVDDAEVRLRVLAESIDDGAPRLSALDSRDPFTVYSDVAGETDIERRQVSLHVTRDAGWGRFKSITAWQRWEMDPGVTDLDPLNYFPAPALTSTIIQRQDMLSHEFRLESPEDGGPWAWRTGVFFLHKSTEGDARREFPFGYWERTLFDLEERGVAAYGRASYAVNEQLELTAGARVEYVQVEIDRLKTKAFGLPEPVAGDCDEWLFSPEFGATYQLCPAARVFARSAIGVKPPGFTAYAGTPASARYDEETAWTNEIGLAVAVPDHRLDFTLTSFWNRIDDYQLNRPGVSTDFLIVNAERVTACGIEAEATWRPLEQLTLRASLGWTDSEFDSYDDPLLAGVDYDGNEVPFVPEFTGGIGARYDFGGGFYVQTAVRAGGETWFNEANERRYRQGSYCVWDAEAGWANETFSVALFGRNLLDEDYYTFINPQIQAGSPGDPQVFGVRVGAAF